MSLNGLCHHPGLGGVTLVRKLIVVTLVALAGAVGVSFFLTESLGQDLEDIWRMEIEPYLEEYFFDQADRLASYRWDEVREGLEQ